MQGSAEISRPGASVSPLRFGTDGVRGVANTELTPELVVLLGRAAARVLHGGTFLIGRDTRRSGPMLQAALSAGLASEGAEVVDLGVLPTPAVAFLSAGEGLPAAMISASHNPFADNGIKLFSAGGRKLADAVEAEIEAEFGRLLGAGPGPHDPATRRSGAGVGRLLGATIADGAERYGRHIVSTLEGRDLEGVKVVLDSANGAAASTAPAVLRALGADVVVIHDKPDGVNINAGCGSNHPADLQAAVVAHRADAGLAFDGDADRVVAVDHTGGLVDGDHIMAICAHDMAARDRLADRTVVVTVMSNLGFLLSMAEAGIKVEQTPVGDRYVLEALDAGGWSLGGEQSGHVIFRSMASTGDGTLTGIHLLDAVRRSGRPLAELAVSAMTALPQVLRSVRVSAAKMAGLADAAEVWDEVTRIEAALGGKGRVLLRPSGTEPVIRVMAEALTAEEAEAIVAHLCDVVTRALGT